MDPYMHNRPSSALKMKIATTQKMVEDEEDDMEEEEEEEGNQDQFGGVAYNLKKTKVSVAAGEKGSSGGGGGGGGGAGVAAAGCQVEKCEADLSDAKKYHKRHKVCEDHAKAPVVIVAGLRQRFCQQCSRFHVVSEFDDAKRSCRRRLAGHNERRRKSSTECRGEGSSHRGSTQYLRENQCIQADETGKSLQRTFTGGSSLKNFHIH